jgi:hypothetical protein
MSEHEKDPFEKYDKLFEEQDRNNIVKSASSKKKHTSYTEPQEPKKTTMSEQDKKRAIRIILTAFFVILFIQAIPVIIYSQGLGNYRIAPFFSIIFVFVIINILIKVFKR